MFYKILIFLSFSLTLFSQNHVEYRKIDSLIDAIKYNNSISYSLKIEYLNDISEKSRDLEYQLGEGLSYLRIATIYSYLNYPQGATHISLQSAVLHLDFATSESEIAYSPIINLPIDLTMASQTLLPNSVPSGSGVKLFLFMISFYQEVNAVQYSLKNEEYNVLNILEVV